MRHALKFCALALVLLAAGAARAEEEVKMPDWVPVFPDVKPTLIENKKTDKMVSVTWNFSTKKTPAEVKAFYEKGFEASGFKKADFDEKSINEPDEGVVQENTKCSDGKRTWFFNARTDKVLKDTVVSFGYQIKE